MLQSIENNAGIIGEDLALLCNYYVVCALNRLLSSKNTHLQDYVSLSIMLQYNSKHLFLCVIYKYL